MIPNENETSQQANKSPAELQHESNLAKKEFGKASLRLSAHSDCSNKGERAWREWLQQRKRWIAGSAAALAVCVTLATPSGNQVLASLINQFRMDQLAVVEQQDLEKLFNLIDTSESTMNPYGEFAHISEGERVSYSTINELTEHVDRQLLIPEIFRSEEPQNLRLRVSPSRSITMKVNVNEINKMMRKLGADKLFPLSIDGKQITLNMGKTVRFDLNHKDTKTSYTFSQQPAPYVTVEAGVPIAEALETVLEFPLIPTNLKQELKQSQILDSGSAPLPVIMPDGYEQIQIANTKVLLPKLNAANGSYSAVWTNNNQLFAFSGTFPNQDAFISMLKEMMGS